MPGPISYVKMAADLDANPKVRRAGRNGREVYLFVLRRVATFRAQGKIPVSNVDPAYLAYELQMSELEAEEGVKACLKRHRNPITGEEESALLSISSGELFVTGWDDDWARYPMSEAERKAAERARKKPDADDEASPRCKSCSIRLPAKHVSPRCNSCEELAARAVKPVSALSGQSGHQGPASGVSGQPQDSSEIPSDLDLDPLGGKTSAPPTHNFDPSSWNPEPTDANTFAALEAKRLGVSIEVQLKRFRAHARKKHWSGERMRDEWLGWLAIARPTPDDLRKAHTAVAARDRERDESEASKTQAPVSDDDRAFILRQLELNQTGLYVVPAENEQRGEGERRVAMAPTAKEATG